ncbi:MAG: rhomboid family intramembrane serine protease [Armatimonadota bacterium]
MRTNSIKDKFVYWLLVDKIPVTKLIILLNFLTLVLGSLCHATRGPLVDAFVFGTPIALKTPWTAVTYPLASMCCMSICFFFGLFWMWIAGGCLERSWGSRRFAFFFFAMSVVSALGIYLGASMTGAAVVLTGLTLPLSGLTIAFALQNPDDTVLFGFIIPMKLKYLAVLDVIIVLVGYGVTNPILGVSALLGCAFSYWFITCKRTASRKCEVVYLHKKNPRVPHLGPLGWYKEYREKKRLKKFFNKSGFKD